MYFEALLLDVYTSRIFVSFWSALFIAMKFPSKIGVVVPLYAVSFILWLVLRIFSFHTNDVPRCDSFFILLGFVELLWLLVAIVNLENLWLLYFQVFQILTFSFPSEKLITCIPNQDHLILLHRFQMLCSFYHSLPAPFWVSFWVISVDIFKFTNLFLDIWR